MKSKSTNGRLDGGVIMTEQEKLAKKRQLLKDIVQEIKAEEEKEKIKGRPSIANA